MKGLLVFSFVIFTASVLAVLFVSISIACTVWKYACPGSAEDQPMPSRSKIDIMLNEIFRVVVGSRKTFSITHQHIVKGLSVSAYLRNAGMVLKT